MEILDFRSDTVTRPTPEMLEAMCQAPTGDDVYGEDPSVNALEAFAADMFGMEAALYCPSGTMTNQIAIKIHTRPGDEVITDQTAHIYNYEGGGIAMNSLASVRLINGQHGKITAADIAGNINDPDNVHFPVSKLVSLENTVNKAGGSVYKIDEVRPIREACKKHGLALHLDGARLFNALVATGEMAKIKEWGAEFDTISICLSKGLGAPVGSLLLGSHSAIMQARRIRKVWGGGMRQAGFIAAAGLYALKKHISRLGEDHQMAAKIREILSDNALVPFIKHVWPGETNIVVVECHTREKATELLSKWKASGVLASAFGPATLRLVTHYDIPGSDIERLSRMQ